MSQVQLPTSSALNEALLQVLQKSPSGMNTKDIDAAVAVQLQLTDEQLSVIRSGNRTEVGYRLAWERTHAKNKGLIEKTSARTWKFITTLNIG
jgi:restriction endonuclease Mrr